MITTPTPIPSFVSPTLTTYVLIRLAATVHGVYHLIVNGRSSVAIASGEVIDADLTFATDGIKSLQDTDVGCDDTPAPTDV